MSSYFFSSLNYLSDTALLEKGAYIVILHADKIPPHIGWLHNGAYFSLKAKGKDFDLPISKLTNILKAKNIKSIFVQVNVISDFSNTKAIFEQINLEHPTDTCLTPIKLLFGQWVGQQKVEKVADLLSILAANYQIKKVYAMGIAGNNFQLPEYGSDEILARISLLQQK
ncbi:MAG: hypothetical protein JJT77_05085 [Crocinitomicaceae bacterium]|nr:hypothetical protein [Crocinitomicaceae bacterium]